MSGGDGGMLAGATLVHVSACVLTADRLSPQADLKPTPNAVPSGARLVPSHALYDAGASFCMLAVFVSTMTAISYVALPIS